MVFGLFIYLFVCVNAKHILNIGGILVCEINLKVHGTLYGICNLIFLYRFS